MKIEEVFIHGFRNLEDIHHLCTSKFTFLVGDNAQGKTNFLEALYVALRGESFRYYSAWQDWVPLSGKTLGVRIQVLDDGGGRHHIQMKENDKRLQILFNEKRISRDQIRGKHPIVVFSPDDHRLIRGEPEERRQFISSVLCDSVPGYGEHLSQYEKALKQRNRLLKSAKEGVPLREIKRQIRDWDQLLAREGLLLLELRDESWPEFSKIFTEVIRNILHCKNVEIQWKVFQDLPTHESYVENLGKSLEKDFATGWTHYGVHREDMDIYLDRISARTSASQGQARILAMGLRWSHAEWIRMRNLESPLFFVDDFSSELDEVHRKALAERLLGSNGQVFLTGTKASLLGHEAESKVFANTSKAYIVNGKLKDRDFIG